MNIGRNKYTNIHYTYSCIPIAANLYNQNMSTQIDWSQWIVLVHGKNGNYYIFFFLVNGKFYRVVWTINALLTVHSEMLQFLRKYPKHQNVWSPPEHFAIGYVHNDNLPVAILHYNMAMCFELATRSVTSPDSENFAPLELQDSLTWEILALPYQKYTFSERKFHEEFKYGIKQDVGWSTKILWPILS